MDEALLSISPASRGKLVKMLINLESYGIFGSNFAYLFISTMIDQPLVRKTVKRLRENVKRIKLSKITKSMLN